MINPLVIKLGLVVGAALAVMAYGGYRDHSGYQRAVNGRAAADLQVVATRVKDNAKVAVRNTEINATVTKAKDEKLAPVIRTIYVDRVRIGTAICPATGTPETDDASGGDEADTGTRLVSPKVEEAVRELDAEVEGHLATGRACQDWGRAHGYIE